MPPASSNTGSPAAPQRPTRILDLPPEVLTLILDHIGRPTALLQLRLVCTSLSHLILSPTLWSSIDFTAFKSSVTDTVISTFIPRIGSGLQHVSLSECQDITVNSVYLVLYWGQTELRELRIRKLEIGIQGPPDAWIDEYERQRATRMTGKGKERAGERLPGSRVQLRKLRSLDVSSTKTDSHHLQSLFVIIPNLEHLNVEKCSNITFFPRSPVLSCLRTLQLKGTKIQDSDIEFVMERCVQLSSISIRQCYNLTDVSLGYFGRDQGCLKNIDCGDCYNLTSGAVMQSLMRCKQLETLNMRGCRKVEEWVMEWLAERVSSLRATLSPLGQFRHHQPVMLDGEERSDAAGGGRGGAEQLPVNALI